MRLLFFLFLLCFMGNSVIASCHCTDIITLESAWNSSVEIFSGKIVEIIPVDVYGYVAKIEVHNQWKKADSAPKHVKYVYSSSEDESCGFNLLEGDAYLLYTGIYQKSVPTVSQCSPSKLMRYARDDIIALNFFKDRALLK